MKFAQQLCGLGFLGFVVCAVVIIAHWKHGAQNTHHEDLAALFPRVNVTVQNLMNNEKPVWLVTSAGDFMKNTLPETKTLLDAMLAKDKSTRFLYANVEYASIKVEHGRTVTIQSSVVKDKGAQSQVFWIAHGDCDKVIETFGTESCMTYDNSYPKCSFTTLNNSFCHNLNKEFGILEEFTVRASDGATFLDQSGVDAVQNLRFVTTISGKQQTTCSDSSQKDLPEIKIGTCDGRSIDLFTKQGYKSNSAERGHCTEAPHHICKKDRKYLLDNQKIGPSLIGTNNPMDEGGFCFSTYATGSSLTHQRQATYDEFSLRNPPCEGCQCPNPQSPAQKQHQKFEVSDTCKVLSNENCKKYDATNKVLKMINNTCMYPFNTSITQELVEVDIQRIMLSQYYDYMTQYCKNTYRFAYDDQEATVVCQNKLDKSKTDVEFNVQVS